MKNISILYVLFATILIMSCNQEDDLDPNRLVDPTDANALSAVLIFPENSENQSGTPPPPSVEAIAPQVENATQVINSSNGSTVPLGFNYSNVDDNLGGCYVQIEGSDTYFTIPYDEISGNSGQLQLPIGLPVNVDEGQFTVVFCVYDINGLVSNIVTSLVSVLRLGTGAIQISLSWNNNSDQDLYVLDPLGESINYTNRFSASGGQLDRDDTDGFGPENIFWLENAPNGEYRVEVDDYTGTNNPTTYYVTVSGPKGSRNFTGTTINGSKETVITFSKNGDDIEF